jgi:hypothetical protein
MRIRYRWARRVTVVTGAIVAAAVASAQSPATKKIDDTHLCRTCVLRIEKVVTLADPVTAMGSSSNLTVIDRDSRGRYWVADYRSRTNVLVFAPDGKLVKRIGREGSGPGEFRNVITLLVGPGDTVHVFDQGNGRRTEIDARTLEVIGAYKSDYYFSIVMRPNGNFVAGYSQAHRGRLFHEIDRNGNLVKAFGGDGQVSPIYTQAWLGRTVFPDRQGGFYAISRRNYAFEHWEADLRLTARWDRNASWFPVSEPRQSRPALHGEPDIFAAWVSADGLLFVGSHVRQDGWEKALGDKKDEMGRAYKGVDDNDRYYDSIIEVIDLKSPQVLATLRDDRYFAWKAANGEIYRKGDDEESIEIYRVNFTRR